jgi:hypothetical protein
MQSPEREQGTDGDENPGLTANAIPSIDDTRQQEAAQ